ncbi:TcpQ domain-containing protein [Castellaniella daejeonensis]|jgi:hypothetical protein|uniref:TcpQ domain-containing protein n=1 Tax=Castellaniella daejeonensis TaxID=659013 RepID=A0ABP3D0P6_9BURK|nr:TcpQ domain-containing protein [Castellaniella sp.]HET8704033.1 TcpQ domain-containing protein [Castellaniella sp.]
MVRLLGAVLLLAGIGGCAVPADNALWRGLAGMRAEPAVYRFDWRIAGDPALAPLQVFDDGRETWLQYPQGQAAPALFERTARGDRLLRPRRDRDYLVLSGVPAHIVLRGGLSQAQAWRESAGSPGNAAAFAPASTPFAENGAGAVMPAAAAPEPGPESSRSPVRMVVAPAGSPPVPPPPSVPPAPMAPPAMPAGDAAVRNGPAPNGRDAAGNRPLSFQVSPADGNVRRALGRWAHAAGWTFEAEHWDVDADIPLAGSAAFGDSFRAAVRGLLSATELGDRPVQPCFYANRVLRVVPLAQRCDRTRVPGADS